MDSYFKVVLIEQTSNPQTCVYRALHQDYSEGFVMDSEVPTEAECGEIAVKQLLSGGRGHYGPFEHPQIIFNCGWFPHSVMQQVRTHRMGISFDVQSFRYSGTRIAAVAEGLFDIEEVFYLRPAGFYSDRQGKKYQYTLEQRQEDIERCLDASKHYALRIGQGLSEEHARGLIPFDVRQHWVLSGNARSIAHLIDLRSKFDAQLECQQLCDLIWPHFEAWMPAFAGWYKENRLHKAKLAP